MTRVISCCLVLCAWIGSSSAFAQERPRSRFERPELGVSAQLLVRAVAADDEFVRAGASIHAAPVGWLVLEAGFVGMGGLYTASGLLRGRIVRRESIALSLATGVMWDGHETYYGEGPGSIGDVTLQHSWSIPFEAGLELRPFNGLTFRPYLGLRVPVAAGPCTVYEDALGDVAREGSGCRPPLALFFGVAAGWSLLL